MMLRNIFWIVLLFSSLFVNANSNAKYNQGTADPVVEPVNVYFEGTITEERAFHVGDTINLEILATDPNSLPLSYVFRLYHKCTYVRELQDWSSVNQMNYTFSAADKGNCFGIMIGIKNNDAIDSDGFFGDVQTGSTFRVND